MKKVAFLVFAASVLVVPLGIAAERAEATLAAPVSESRKVIIDGRLWSCEGDKCTAGSQGRDQPIRRECARAAKVLGPIVAYRQGARSLDAAGLAACNASQEAARAAPGFDVAATVR